DVRVTLPLVGAFQAANALCALTLALASGDDAESALAALETVTGAPGRVQLAGRHPSGAPVFVDYAHTPDALANVLKVLRPHASGLLHLVFGCGGDRDPGKRPEMGAIAARLADVVIITDDNPRTENPAEIRAQILAAAGDAADVGDRAEAIAAAVDGLEAGDLLVVAGKGHERGQIVGDETRPFDDVQAVRDALGRIGK
ncbi:MAG: glutamate ligase domain-containing protein, partial [Rhodospirillales bacterium]